MVRSHVLYPIELRAHLEDFRHYIITETTLLPLTVASNFSGDLGRCEDLSMADQTVGSNAASDAVSVNLRKTFRPSRKTYPLRRSFNAC